MKDLKIIAALFFMCIMFSCDKYDLPRSNPRDTESETYRSSVPTLTTTVATAITSSSATVGGSITADGYATIISRGVCWSTTTNPTAAGSKIVIGAGTGIFSGGITGLLPNTKYYLRAYATNSAGTGYGNEISFTTLVSLPTITTTNISLISTTSATSGGNITSDGGATVTTRGVCWSTSANPTITLGTKTLDGTGTGVFTSSLTRLAGGTTYYVRAYAANSFGIVYGNEIIFKTSGATVTTTSISGITATTATSGGNVTSDGGSTVTARGVCWSTSIDPTVSLTTKTTNGTGTGAFTSSITGLTANTTYYVRAYATNTSGTSYGTEISFMTVVIGATYQGGRVAYIFQSGDPGYIEGETHGLIAATTDQSTAATWWNGSNITTGATGTALGTGNANTNSIVAAQGTGNYAAKLCYDLVLGGYVDWYLPSKDELNKLYLNRTSIGGFTTYDANYWSSTEVNSNDSYGQYFTGGPQYFFNKINTLSVRAVRSF
jgi:hypothetical protein